MRNRTDIEIELFLIRHGATAWNAEGRYLGRTNVPLSELGRADLMNKQVPEADVVWVSPMLRARQTAEIFYPDIIPVEVKAFREMDFGIFEGMNYEQLNGNPDYQAYIDSGGEVAFPEGENRTDFVARTMNGFQTMLSLLEEDMQKKQTKKVRVAIVAHGGTVMAIASELCGGEYFSYQVKNGAYLTIRGEKTTARDMTWNIIS